MLRSHCRTIRCDRHDWPFVADRGISLRFHVRIRGDGSRYVLIRVVAIGCDLLISRVTICHGLILRSDTITYVPIGLFRLSPRLGLDLTRSSRSGSPNWDDLVRADTFRYVYQEPLRSITIGYGCSRDVFHDHDRRCSRLSYDWT